MTVQYILGVDGGGTKTIARLENLSTGEVFEQYGGSSSLTSDFEGACITLMQLFEGLIQRAKCQPSDVCVVLGLAGAGNQSQVARLQRRLALPFAKLEIYNDARTSLFGANFGDPVVMVALGTGSVGARLDENQQEHYVGGWGFPIGDEGSGAKLGFHAIQVLLTELDTYDSAQSQLAKMVLSQLGPDKDDILNWLRNSKPSAYAQLTPNIFSLAKDCPAALGVVRQHAKDVEKLILLARKEQDIPVVLMGGLAKDTLGYLSKETAEFCQLQVGSSLDGACLLAKLAVQSILQDKEQAHITQTQNIDKQEQELQTALLAQLSNLVSEERNPQTMDIDLMSTSDILQTINEQDNLVAAAIKPCISSIGNAVDKIVDAFGNGGRLVYIGAGTSGRLGILDAVECPPTFSVTQKQVVGIIAGGNQAIYKAVEGAEDNPELAKRDLEQISFNEKDILVGIAASGRTPYVLGAINYAKTMQATTISVTCNPGSIVGKSADIEICPVVGPEVLTGSTRMKSGTAQKLVLNMLTTASMIRSGKSYENLMVDVYASNDKLHARAVRIVMQATQCDQPTAQKALEAADYRAKLAILLVLTGVEVEQGQMILEQNRGFLRKAVKQIQSCQTAT